MPVTTRRDFLKLGALFAPVVAAPTVAYSFLWVKPLNTYDSWAVLYGTERCPDETDDVLCKRLAQMWLRPIGRPGAGLASPHPAERGVVVTW